MAILTCEVAETALTRDAADLAISIGSKRFILSVGVLGLITTDKAGMLLIKHPKANDLGELDWCNAIQNMSFGEVCNYLVEQEEE